MNIKTLQRDAYNNAVEHGWHEEDRTFGELIALCHSELSEALEDFRNGCKPTELYFQEPQSGIILKNEVVTGTFRKLYKPCGIPSELADVVIRIADMCGKYGIDLEGAVILKHEYNKTRPHKHGGKII